MKNGCVGCVKYVVMMVLTAMMIVSPIGPVLAMSDYTDLAYRWAPVHYQDTDDTDADADFITAINYDGDWMMNNNWEHQDDDASRLKGSVTYSVTETSSHYFVIYTFYHPRDWVDYPDFGLDTHENDAEGAMMIVRKDGTTYGKLEGMVTVYHNDFYSYITEGSPLTDGKEDIDGTIRMVNVDGVSRPTTYQDAKGHGLYNWNGKNFPGGDGVVYYPDRQISEAPSNGNDRSVKYTLVNTFAPGGLWDHRYDSNTFASWGTFKGDNGKDNAANTAWKWNDSNDGTVGAGEMATDPVHLMEVYFGNLGSYSRTYVYNGYR